MINLFEYQNKQVLEESFLDLEIFLDDIWKRREKTDYFRNADTERIEVQQFVQFLHKTKEIKSNKYVGVIHFEGKKINLLPKIFYDSAKDYTEKDVNVIQNHILWWLSYCRKIKFPNYQTGLGSTKSDFFEILIYLFSKYTKELLSKAIFQQYEEVENELPFIKGRLNTNRYINENVARGNWHKLNCTYDAFEIDNKFNRIIKYVSKLLLGATSNAENKKYLLEILFILDEVKDERATAEECSGIKFNPILTNFETVRDYCYLFLNNSISVDYKNDLKLFAFLLPMEYLFEDFIFGFVEKELPELNVKAQISDIHLDLAKNFKLKPDLKIQATGIDYLVDTKYKIIYSDSIDPKNGISQNDLYQMAAYAIRFNIQNIKLFYPNTINGCINSVEEIIIKDELSDKDISIKTYQLPVVDVELLAIENSGSSLGSMFENGKNCIILALNQVFNNKICVSP